MKVLFVSASPLRWEISIGNTFLELFSGLENIELASVYTKGGIPDPEISRAFLITEKMLLNTLRHKGTFAGKVVFPGENDHRNQPDAAQHEFKKKTFSFFHKNRWTIFFLLQNALWSMGKWKSDKLRRFIEEYQPDVIFTLLTDARYLNRVILHVKELGQCKLAVFAWDDNYSYRLGTLSPLKYLHRAASRVSMRRVVAAADCLYAISEVQKQEYEAEFSKQFKILTKSKDFLGDAPLWTEPKDCVRLLYAGNLSAGRWKSMVLIAEAVERLNRENYSVRLDVYSATPQTKKMKKRLNREGCALHDAVSYEEVQKLQKQADVLIHAEGMSRKSRMAVHQSFSTKLVDYFALGKCIFAVGTSDVASIQHLLEHDAAVVADNSADVYSKLKQLLERPEVLSEYGRNAYLCGRKQHNRAAMQTMLMADLREAAEKPEPHG